ncbi:MAG: Holliday junction resolvase RuvX [Patescibacteria group bacterium]|jgi:putative Holliday junction resolvase|nr:Holliday junction resolvase RuvX [Patescibacteria group bacterium]MDD5172952.1 Holliday junction resolvase RuvX [Patescibacteria group bacterium]
MRILAIDYGSRQMGLALADDKIRIATPYRILPAKEEDAFFIELKKIIFQEKVEKIIIGRPVSLLSKETTQTEKTDFFIKTIKEKIKLPIVIVDERLTSKMADKLLFDNQTENHAIAASIILQNYLSRTSGENSRSKIDVKD